MEALELQNMEELRGLRLKNMEELRGLPLSNILNAHSGVMNGQFFSLI
jgi:hypothetical protein